MNKASTIGLDLAKQVFQVHGADASGAVVFRKRLRRTGVLQFFAAQAPCRVAMEACASSHYWGRELSRVGHEVRLIPPAYVKPFVKRQKNDAADAEAICEASQRPTMRFVQIKSEAAQAGAVVFRARDLLVRQRTQIINALRGHLAEFGLVVTKGPAHVGRLVAQVADYAYSLPQAVRPVFGVLIEALHSLDEKIAVLDAEILSSRRRGRGCASTEDHSRDWPRHGSSDQRLGTSGADLCERARFCRLAGAHAVAAIYRRQTEAWQNLENGRAHTTPPIDHRGECSGALGCMQRSPRGVMAGAHARTQATHACHGRARQ